MPRPKTVEAELRAAFERLKSNASINVEKGTQVSLSNVAKEADMNPASFRRERYPQIHAEIQSYVEINNANDKQEKPKKKKASQTKRLKNQTLKIQELMNIVEAQNDLIAELESEIEKFKSGNLIRLKNEKQN